MNDLSHLKGATALVTGANGFIGSHLVDRLLAAGCTVHGLVRQSSDLKWLDVSQMHLHKVDLAQADFKLPALEDVDYIFHCAGLTQAKTRAGYFAVNATACSNLYEQCRERAGKIKGIVHLSSLAAVGPSTQQGGLVDETSPCRPVTFYGQSKLAGEEIALRFSNSLPVMVLRPPVVYGPREENFFTFESTILCCKVCFREHKDTVVDEHDVDAITGSEFRSAGFDAIEHFFEELCLVEA